MRTNPASRPRFVSQVVAGLSSITAGIFGVGSPVSGDQIVSHLDGTQLHQTPLPGFYAFHQGDLFTPGTANFVLDPSLETPMQTNWGHGFAYENAPFNTFPTSAPLISNPNLITNAQRGMVAGQIMLQNLLAQNPARPTNG